MTRQLTLVGLLVATLLALSSFALIANQANAFDPGGPPGGGGVPKVVTGNWEFINYQPTGGSYSPQYEINSENVEWLETKWLYPYPEDMDTHTLTRAQSGSSAPPIIVDGVAYIAKNTRYIHAVSMDDGSLIWQSDGGSQLDTDQQMAEFPYIGGPGAFSTFGHVHAINYYRDYGWLIMSSWSCYLAAWNIEDGSLAWEMTPDKLCGTGDGKSNEELGNPVAGRIGTLGNMGFFSGLSSHPPMFSGDTMVWPVMGGSGLGGRASVKGFDMASVIAGGEGDSATELWRTWVMPHEEGEPNWAQDQCDDADGNGWYFSFPDFFEGKNAINCRDVPADAVVNDWINMVEGTPRYGKVHTSSAIATVWGNYPIHEQLRMVYMGTGDIGPYPNSSYKAGPNLHGSGIIALNVDTGKLEWWFATNPRDLWDMDCSWGGILAKSAGVDTLVKGCKNGLIYSLNAATGEPVWVFEPPAIDRAWCPAGQENAGPGGVSNCTNYGVGPDGSPTHPDACCRITKEHMNKAWAHYPSDDPWYTMCYTECLESDIAYDGKNIYAGFHINKGMQDIKPMVDFGNNGAGLSSQCEVCVDRGWVYAIDINTGEIAWEADLSDTSGFRGGLLVTGGVLYVYAADGNLHMFDTETGERLGKKFFGVAVSVAPTIGTDNKGAHRIIQHVGGGGGFLFASHASQGSLLALGLKDNIPDLTRTEIREVIRTVEVEKEVEVEVVREVQVERIVEVEKIVEVDVEVVRTVEVPVEITTTEEVVSPISYVAIGLGVVLIVISGTLFARSRK